MKQAANCYQTFKLRAACQTMMELAQLGNSYFDRKKPWQDAKNPDTVPKMETTIACCFECLKALALISCPIIPETAEKVWRMLGNQTSMTELGWEKALKAERPLQKLPATEILFKKIEDQQIEQEISKLKHLGSYGKSEV